MLTVIEQRASGQDFGWGDREDPLSHKMFKERSFADTLGFTDLNAAIEAKGEETPIEKLARESMPIDDGWDFDYVDKMFYGAAACVNQNPVGSCVGAGAGSAVASKISHEILIEGDYEAPFGLRVRADGVNSNLPDCGIPYIGYHYGCGKMRQLWTGSEFRGRGNCSDGSYCSVQIWALMTCGILPCSMVKGFSKGPQGDDVRSWGCNKNGELNAHLSIGQQFLMENSVRCRTGDDLKNTLTKIKNPCMICSGWAFMPSHFVEGLGWVYKRNRRDSWSHNMSIVAVFLYKGVWYVKVRNQWGPNAHKDGWYFIITLEEAHTWLANAECQSIGELKLKKAKTL